MADPLDIQVPWPGWHAIKHISCDSSSVVYEIERDIEGKPVHCAMKVVGVPPEGRSDYDLEDGHDGENMMEDWRREAYTIMNSCALMTRRAHPNIVSCQDMSIVRRADEQGYDVFIRMELLTPLTEWMRCRETSSRDAATVGRDIARALADCEANNVVHRNVKPRNIWADRWGTFKLGDFDIACTMEGTQEADIVGTPSYMAPEVRSGRYGQTVDIYSLGIVMWWMLAGRRLPFEPEDVYSTDFVERRFEGEPLPAPEGCPQELSRIVLKACAYHPEDRYQSADEMAADLDAFLAGDGGARS